MYGPAAERRIHSRYSTRAKTMTKQAPPLERAMTFQTGSTGPSSR